MGPRRAARGAALQMLYQLDMTGQDAAHVIAQHWRYLSSSADGRQYADELVRGYVDARLAVDDAVRRASEHWRLERMSRVDRNVLRLAAYELLYRDDVPSRVVLNEAIELAKRFGSESSAAFVNGILDRIASDRERG